MEQRLSIVTLGVEDVGRAKRFYDDLGWSGQEVEETVFYQAGGMAVVVWSGAKLVADAGLADAPGAASPRMALAQKVRTREEVDAVLAATAAAGATVTQPAADTFYAGYAGYFSDPDGHLWEIAHNPGFTLTADGSLVLPDFEA